MYFLQYSEFESDNFIYKHNTTWPDECPLRYCISNDIPSKSLHDVHRDQQNVYVYCMVYLKWKHIPFDVNNGNSRGFGFITMDKEAAESAVDSLDGIELDGRIISVNEARARGPPKENNSWEDEDEDENPWGS